MSTIKTIFVTFQKEAIHKYPAAKDMPGIEFLAYPHRHIFHFRVEVDVKHDDRDIEFILFKRELEAVIDYELKNMSCEMMANIFVDYIQSTYPDRTYISVTVSEDGENGATVTWRKD